MTEDLSHYNPEGSELRILQLRMLEILETVDGICRKHDIPYWISGGTLLGAMRHGGFIPWDDDIDIELMRPDYKRLLKILRKELPDNLYLQTPKEKGYRLLFSKVRDKFSIIHSEEEDMAPYKEKGVYIDIFTEERTYRKLKDFVDFFYGRAFRRLKRGRPFRSLRYFYEYSMSLLLYPLGYLFVWVARAICAITKPNNILHSYGIGNSTNHNAGYMFPPAPVKFEGKYFFAPKDPDTYLKKQYGNYMDIPPVDKRESHFTAVEYLDSQL
ncbi:phosphorylcholine transferase LicD [Dysgonomonas sp. 216]|uniref:LicD family protein n=1 Tax=Dysgonomonas sp. 216 TaxID=2302934 RepID=UPI001C886523|nr:LicD family protein [Dysgonomonas sp. 216]